MLLWVTQLKNQLQQASGRRKSKEHESIADNTGVLEIGSVISANITIQPKQNYVEQQNGRVVLRMLLAHIKTQRI